MSIKIEDVKPGDILFYRSQWYILIVQTDTRELDYVWISGNSRPNAFKAEAYRLRSKEYGSHLKIVIADSVKIAHLDVHTFIGELEKLKNDNRTI